MGGCVAPGCHNSSTKGFVMKVFPRDPRRRAQWVRNVGREDWSPTNNSCLCEVHFNADMWESKRQDNKRKLKLNAVPTIFRKNPHVHGDNEMYEIKIETQSSTPLSHNSIQINGDFSDDKNQIIMLKGFQMNILSANKIKCDSCEFLREELKNKDLKIKKSKRTIGKLHYEQLDLRKNIRVLKNQLVKLQKKINDDKYKNALYRVFTKDQAQALFSKSQRARNWSIETVQRALELKFACGIDGYVALIRRGMPLPSLRTLRRKLDEFKDEPSISEKILEFLVHKDSDFENESEVECDVALDEATIAPQENQETGSECDMALDEITIPQEESEDFLIEALDEDMTFPLCEEEHLS